MYELPLFPLNTVLFPGMPIHLHIFEMRYRAMIRRCLDGHRPFGVVLIRKGQEVDGPATPYSIGTSAIIAHLEPVPGGSMNLVALGMDRFRILELHHDQPYLTGRVEDIPLEKPHTLAVVRAQRTLREQMVEYLRLISRGLEDAPAPEELPMQEDVLHMLFSAAALLQVPVMEKQALLESKNAGQLLANLQRLYRRETALLPFLGRLGEDRLRRAAGLS